MKMTVELTEADLKIAAADYVRKSGLEVNPSNVRVTIQRGYDDGPRGVVSDTVVVQVEAERTSVRFGVNDR